jgi:hypothetical protein
MLVSHTTSTLVPGSVTDCNSQIEHDLCNLLQRLTLDSRWANGKVSRTWDERWLLIDILCLMSWRKEADESNTLSTSSPNTSDTVMSHDPSYSVCHYSSTHYSQKWLIDTTIAVGRFGQLKIGLHQRRALRMRLPPSHPGTARMLLHHRRRVPGGHLHAPRGVSRGSTRTSFLRKRIQ